jgi:SPP1 family predicted phage head-tail adaptor
MRSGTLRERIAVREKVVTRDSYGAEAITWADFALLWASAEPISGREFVALRSAQSDLAIRFRIRYTPGVQTTMQVRWNGADYPIDSIIDRNARNREMELLCTGPADV